MVIKLAPSRVELSDLVSRATHVAHGAKTMARTAHAAVTDPYNYAAAFGVSYQLVRNPMSVARLAYSHLAGNSNPDLRVKAPRYGPDKTSDVW